MLAMLLTAALMVAPPEVEGTTYQTINFSDVLVVTVGDFLPIGSPDGKTDMFVMLEGGECLLIQSMTGVTLDATSATLKISTGDDDKPTVFKTEYIDQEDRTHSIVTDCARYSRIIGCANAHAEAIKAFESIFPRRSVIKDFEAEYTVKH